MDLRATTLPRLIAWSVEQFAEHTAIADGEVRLSYTELGEQIEHSARALLALGVQPGDGVGLWAPNSWRWVVAALAAARVGAVLVPINTRFKGAEAAYVLGRTRARLLFTVNGFLDTDYVASLQGHDLPSLETAVLMGGDPTGDAITWDAFISGGEPGRPTSVPDAIAEIERRAQAVTVQDISLVMFTSGTTGHPKGVQVRGSAIVRAFEHYGSNLLVNAGDPYLLVNPYFHAFGFNAGIVTCLTKGATNVPLPVFDVTTVLQTIERERIVAFPGPPAVFQSLLNAPDLDRYDLSSLRAAATGAANIPVEMVVAMRERLGFDVVITSYGMTETSGLATTTGPGDPDELVATTSGCAITDVEIRVVDDDGRDVPTGTTGELLVRGFQVTPGYLDDPEATAEAIDSDGWLHTGDIAVMNELGYIDITDRKKDMFINGGFNAYPAEIERVLAEHPHVGIVAVIGVPDERLGEVGAAFVVARPGTTPEPDEIVAWCRERMANYKAPRYVWLVEELPVTASNKVRKPELRELAAQRRASAR